MKIALIGGGNMGEATLCALIGKKLALPGDITVSDVADSRRTFLAQKYGVRSTAYNRKAIPGADVVILAVKPQVLPGVITELSGKLTGRQLVISIIAGARLESISSGLNHEAIVRSMPNTPAQIGEGITVWTATPEVNRSQKQTAAKILGAMGTAIFVEDEHYLDMATAVSGSGPAYLFYFIEAFIEGAIAIGWQPEDAKTLVLGTVLGAAHLLKQSGKDAGELRQTVTSKGGTTAAAISRLEDGKFKSLVGQAVKAALERAVQLGDGK